MLGVISSYIFSGVVGNLAYRILVALCQRVFNKNIEDYFVDAFKRAVKDQREYLSQKGEPVEIDEDSFRQIISQMDRRTEIVKMDEDVFIRHLAKECQQASVLIIGGHNLSMESYESLILNLLIQARTELQQAVTKNQPIFNEILLAEIGNNKAQFNNLKTFFEEKFNLVMTRLRDAASLDAESTETNSANEETVSIAIREKKELMPGESLATQIRDRLIRSYDLEEFQNLCQDLNVDYDSLRGEGKIGKARELINYLNRRNQINKLIEILGRE